MKRQYFVYQVIFAIGERGNRIVRGKILRSEIGLDLLIIKKRMEKFINQLKLWIGEECN